MARKSRKWYQFKLRTLFLLILASGPAIGWGSDLYAKISASEALPGVWFTNDKIYYSSVSEFKLTQHEAKALKAARNDKLKEQNSRSQQADCSSHENR